MELEPCKVLGASQSCDGCGAAWAQEVHLEGDKLEMGLEGEGPWLAVVSELEQLRSWSSSQFITFVFCLPKPKLVRSAGSSLGEGIAGFLKFSS